MGSNKRYPSTPPSQTPRPFLLANSPVTLTPAELEDELASLREGKTPAVAWVRFGDKAELVECLATAWSAHAVRVEFEGPMGELRQVWVWRGAVRPPR